VKRDRVFVLASSKDQAALFARRWASEAPGRRLTDAIYLHGGALDGHLILSGDRVVGVEGYWRHPKAEQIEQWLKRTLAKTGLPLDIEPVATHAA